MHRQSWWLAGVALLALVAHGLIWWWAAGRGVSADLVIAFYGSRLVATALVWIALTIFVFPVAPNAGPAPGRRSLLIAGRFLWTLCLVLLVIQAVLFQRNALRLFFDRFALRLF